MSKIEQLRAITKIANEKLKLEQEVDNEEFFNGDLFKTILSDFEKDALEVAQEGKHFAFISIYKYVDGNYDPLIEKMFIKAMERIGYRYLNGTYMGFTWGEIPF